MAYKDIEKRREYDRERYKKTYIPHPMIKKTREEKLATRRRWRLKNKDKLKAQSIIQNKKDWVKHKEKRVKSLKEWIEKNKEHYREYHKKYNKKHFQQNKEDYLRRGKVWAKNNPEKIKNIRKRYKQNHPEEIAEGLAKYTKTLKGKYRTLKGSGTKRGYIIDISFEEFRDIVSKPCKYCGEDEKRIGIDRVDNSIGYTKENSVPCCTLCNMMKKNYRVEDFLSHIKKIYKFKV